MATSPQSPVHPPELPDEVWQPTVEPTWWRRWTRGWRLVVVMGVAASGYLVWRGPTDYRAVKAWRGRALAADATAAARDGRIEEARRLLDRAGVLGPRDAAVLRAIADFSEPRDDVMALYALRQLLAVGKAEEADLQRLARLAFDWGRPELAPAEALRTWAGQPAEGLDAGRLEAGARWLAGRGLVVEAETRLRRALTLATDAGRATDVGRLNLALARLLATDASGTPSPDRVQEAGARWLLVGRDPAAPPRQAAAALENLVPLLLSDAGRPLLDETTAAGVRDTLAFRLDTAPAATRAGLRLALAELDLHLQPLDRRAVLDDLVADARTSPDDVALRTARWFNRRGHGEEAQRVADPRVAAAPADPAWFVVRLDALYAQRRWDEVRSALEAAAQPLPPVQRQLFLYRLAGVADPDGPARDRLLTALRESARTAAAKDLLLVADSLETAGERPLAIEFYRQVQRHEQAGLAARLGLVRCLHQQLDDAAELIDTLEALLTLWPDANEARGDLAYLRLLPPAPLRADDVAVGRELVEEAPQFLAFRMLAALAALRDQRPADALAATGGRAVPWEQVRPGWRAVQACVLAANGQTDAARSLAATVPAAALRPGERQLLQQHALVPGS